MPQMARFRDTPSPSPPGAGHDPGHRGDRPRRARAGHQLVDRGAAVRAVTRRPGSAGLPDGVEVVFGDAGDPASLDAAFAGVEEAFLMSAQPTGSAEGPTHDFALVDAAKRAGVGRVVKLSVLGGGGPGDDPLATWHRRAERAVMESGIDWTLLRPGRFMSNTLGWARMIRQGDIVSVAFASRPAASIDPADIAAVAAAALTGDGRTAVNTAYELSGPQSLTPAQELHILAEALGRKLRLVEPPIDATRSGLLRSGMPEAVVDAVLARTLDDDRGTEVLPTVQDLLGRPATSFATWATRHVDSFR